MPYKLRTCLCARNQKKALKASNLARTLRPYEAVYRCFLRTAVHTVNITYEEFLTFTEIKNCYYCDGPITWHIKSATSNKSGIYLRYNLDRKDSSVGYSLENCVVCCHHCNKAKMNSFSAEEFKQIINLIKKMRGSWP